MQMNSRSEHHRTYHCSLDPVSYLNSKSGLFTSPMNQHRLGNPHRARFIPVTVTFVKPSVELHSLTPPPPPPFTEPQ